MCLEQAVCNETHHVQNWTKHDDSKESGPFTLKGE